MSINLTDQAVCTDVKSANSTIASAPHPAHKPTSTPPPSNMVSIFNLDALEQARVWQRHGPERATVMLLAAIRAALLLGESVHLDRNQLFEGIFFIAMSPDRLAWHLGLEPGAKLPITVQLLGASSDEVAICEGPWSVGSGMEDAGWAVSRATAEAIERNYWAVAGDRDRVSSPSQAMNPAPLTDEQSAEWGVANVNRGDGYASSDHVFLPERVWQLRDGVLNKHLITEGRRRWVDALKEGRVRVLDRSMQGGSAAPATPDVARFLRQSLESRAELVMKQRREVGTAYARFAQLLLSVTQDSGSSGTVRSLIVRWLNGETVAALTPPTLHEALESLNTADQVQSSQLDQVKDLALSWWIQGYYRAIAHRDGLDIFQFHEPVTNREDSAEMQSLEEEWGLRPCKQSRWRMLFRRNRGGELNDQSTYGVKGDLLTHMAEYTPGQYSRIRSYAEQHSAMRDDDQRKGEWLAELAIASKDANIEIGRRRARMKLLVRKAVTLLIVGIAVVVIEQKVEENTNTAASNWLLPLFIILLVINTVPWGELKNVYDMSAHGLKSTITVDKHD